MLLAFSSLLIHREARPNLILFQIDTEFLSISYGVTFSGRLLHSVVLSLGDLPMATPVCHCGCSLGLELDEGGEGPIPDCAMLLLLIPYASGF